MEITLRIQEAEFLEGLLKKVLGETRQEVYRSDVAEFKDELKRKEALIRSILAKLTEEA
jgi:hypothetical protein